MDSLPPDLQICPTLDGSPTILFSQGTTEEKMHSSKGALSESLYIYGEAVSQVIDWQWPLRIMSIGLGLGYNEMIAFHIAQKKGLNLSAIQVSSFEAHPFLRESFVKWLMTESTALETVYEQILHMICDKNAVDERALKANLQSAFANGQLKILDAFPQPLDNTFTCIFYDAYCAKTSPELWDEEFLKQELRPILHEKCLLTTYAAKGSLNRALKELNFQLAKRDGFSGKRESTWALRKET